MKSSLPRHLSPDQASFDFTVKWSTRRRTIGLQVTTAGDLILGELRDEVVRTPDLERSGLL